MANREIFFIENQKGHPALLYDGHRYNFSHNNKNSNNWKCANRSTGCFASATLNKNKDTVLKVSEHVCKRHYSENIRSIAIDTCKAEVCKKMTPVKKVFEKMVIDLHEADPDFSMCSFDEVRSSFYRARHRYLNQKTTEFTRLENVKVPDLLADEFLVLEDGDTEKILIFSTKVGREFVRKTAEKQIQYYGDGTYKRKPKPFSQLYSIHANIEANKTITNVVPVLFALLPNKNQNTYTRFFTLLRDEMGANIQKFKCDYELAQINACESVYPNCELTGCYFHYNRAVWKKAKLLKIDTTTEGRKFAEMCADMPLLPQSEIYDMWVTLLSEAPVRNEFMRFKQYMETTWLKLGPHKLSCAQEKHRTNNPVEGWHRRLNIRMLHKPTLVRFLYKLRREAKYQDTRICNPLFSGAKRQRCDVVFDRKYQQQLSDLSQGLISATDFLEIVIRLKKRQR